MQVSNVMMKHTTWYQSVIRSWWVKSPFTSVYTELRPVAIKLIRSDLETNLNIQDQFGGNAYTHKHIVFSHKHTQVSSHFAGGRRLQPSGSGTGTAGWCSGPVRSGFAPDHPEAFAPQTRTPDTSGGDASTLLEGSPGCRDAVAWRLERWECVNTSEGRTKAYEALWHLVVCKTYSSPSRLELKHYKCNNLPFLSCFKILTLIWKTETTVRSQAALETFSTFLPILQLVANIFFKFFFLPMFPLMSSFKVIVRIWLWIVLGAFVLWLTGCFCVLLYSGFRLIQNAWCSVTHWLIGWWTDWQVPSAAWSPSGQSSSPSCHRPSPWTSWWQLGGRSLGDGTSARCHNCPPRPDPETRNAPSDSEGKVIYNITSLIPLKHTFYKSIIAANTVSSTLNCIL